MRQPLRVLLTIFVLTSISAFADTINYTNLNVNLVIRPNTGSGGNIGGLITGPGVNLSVGGGSFAFWFGSDPYAPGSIGGGGTDIFWDNAFGEIGSQSYGFGDIQLQPVSLNAGSFTFPTNGKDFTITLPASIDVITGSILTTYPFPTFTLTTNPGHLTLSFFYSNATGLYFASSGSFTTVPEPGTLGLMATGIVAATWRRLKQRRA